MAKKTYSEKLKDPRWQKKRLEILNRDEFTCQKCGDTKSTLIVHHFEYFNEPWDANNDMLITVCECCHKVIESIKDKINTKSGSFKLVHYESSLGENITGVISKEFSGLLVGFNGSKTAIMLTEESVSKIQDIINLYKSLKA